MLVADSSTVQEGVELDEIGVVLWCCGAVVLELSVIRLALNQRTHHLESRGITEF